MANNTFDQFDSTPAPAPSQPANTFDQFDSKANTFDQFDKDNSSMTLTQAVGTMLPGNYSDLEYADKVNKAVDRLKQEGKSVADAFVNSPVTKLLKDFGVASGETSAAQQEVENARSDIRTEGVEAVKTAGQFIGRIGEDVLRPEQMMSDTAFIEKNIGNTLSGATSQATSDPIGALVSLGTTVESNPQYMTGMGEVSGVSGTILGKAREMLIETAKAGGSMSGIAAATSVISQVQENGFADPTQTAKDVISAGTLGAALHGIREVANIPGSLKANTDETYNIDTSAPPEANEVGSAQEAIKNMSQVDNDTKAIYRALQAAKKAPRIQLDDSAQVDSLENEGGMVPRETPDESPAQAPDNDTTPQATPHQSAQGPITKLSQFETTIDAAPGTPEFYQEMANHVDRNWTNLDPKLQEAIGTQAHIVRGDSDISPEDVQHVYMVEKHAAGGVGNQQGGGINPALALGATTGIAGAIYGYGKDKDLYKALGMGVVGAVAPFVVKGIFNSMRASNIEAVRILNDTSQDFFKKWDGNLKVLPLKEMRAIANMRRFIKPEDDLAVRQAELNNNPETLTPEQRGIYNSMRNGYDQRGNFLMKKSGSLKALVEDYAPRQFVIDPDKAPDDVQKFMSTGDYDTLSPKSRNFISRTLDPGKEGYLKAINELGLKPKYESAIDNYTNYMSSTSRALINTASLKALVKSGAVSTKWSPGKEEIPSQYLNQIQKWLPSEYANEPKGKFIRYDKKWYADSNVAPSIQHMMDAPKVSAFMSAVDTANLAVKQVALFSFFHAKTLSEHQILMNLGDPKAAFLDANQIISGSHPIFKQLMYGKSGDIIEHMVKNGLTISTPEDGGSEAFYKGTEHLNEAVEAVLKQAGLPESMGSPAYSALAGADIVAKRFNDITWQRVFTGSKLVTAINKFNDVKLKNSQDYAAGKAKRLLNDQEIAEAITLTTNNVFGGQNWLRMSMDSKNAFMQQLKLRAFKPSSRIWWQRLLFAPDWTVSNFRAVVKGTLGASATGAQYLGNKIAPGTIEAPSAMEKAISLHHASFVARAGAMYLIAANILNKINSGHYIWQNKDPLTVELDPDGRRTMVLDKSVTEVGEMFREPGKTLSNKASILVKEAIQQGTNSKYFSPGYSAPPIVPHKVYAEAKTFGPLPLNGAGFQDAGYRMVHLASNFAPIAAKTAVNGKPGAVGSALSGFFGVPIYYHGQNEKPLYSGMYGSGEEY